MIQYKRIGEMLFESGLITQKQLDHAMKTKLGTNLRFGEILTSLGYVSEDQVTLCLAEQYGYKVADLAKVQSEPEALAIVPSITALSGLVLPLHVSADSFHCVIADPLDVPMSDALFHLAGRPVEFSLASPTPLFDAITKAYNLGPKVKHPRTARQVPGPNMVSNDSLTAETVPTPNTKRRIKVDPQDDKFALLAALGSGMAGCLITL